MAVDYYNSLGLLYASRQKHQEAIWAFQKALDLDAGCAEAFYNQALSLTAQGRLNEAIDSYTNAIRVRPDFQEAYYNLGNLYKKKGFNDKAVKNYSIAVKLQPDSPAAYNNLGICLNTLKRFEQAVDSYIKAIGMKPDYAEAYNNLGLTLQDQGYWAQAVEKFETAITLKPDHSGAYYNLGFALNELGEFDGAVMNYRRSIQLKPDFADAHSNIGAILKTEGKIEDAIFHYRKALEYCVDKAEIYNNLGNALEKSGRINVAIEMIQRALEERPDFAEAYNNLGVALNSQGSYMAAVKNYEKALELKPELAEARFNRATIDLLFGRFSRGWQGYEWRLKKKHWKDIYPLRHNLPRWDGSPFPEKRLYVHDEQGFGDTIQFVRYLPRVKALGGSVILGTRKPLLGCLQGIEEIDEVIDRSAVGDPTAGCDLVVPLLSLPGIFGTDLNNIPSEIPYLHPQEAKVSYWKHMVNGQGFKIGLVWAGNPDHEKDHVRSTALNDLISLADIPGVHLFGLQKGIPSGQATEIPSESGFINLGPKLKDFSDTAAVMANMDLIISVDTAAAHLAGALGLPVWTLVYFSPDWRWMLDRDDSPWYPTMRLFRQSKRDDWEGVIFQLTSELKKAVQKRGSGQELDTDTGLEIATRHYQAGRCVQAKQRDHRNLQAKPDNSPTLHVLGVAAHEAGNYDQALTLIAGALALDPHKPQYYYNFGMVCAALGDLQAAINAYRQAIHLKPDYIEAYGNLGAALKDQIRYDEALDLFDQILKIVPAEAKIHHGRGQVLSAQGQYAKAIEAFDRAIGLNPDKAIFYNSLGIALGLLGEQSTAIKAFERALNLQPNLAEAVNNLGTAVQEQGEFEMALEYFNQAIQIRPNYGEACFNRGAIHLLKGNFEQGWRDYECRTRQSVWKHNHGCPGTMPRWEGFSFSGKRLCVHSEQGLGDTLQFLRYLPLVKARGGTVILETSGLLRELVKNLKGVDEFVAQDSQSSTGVDHDICVHLLSLPGIFKTTLETIPVTIPYVVADSIKVSYWKQKLSSRDLKVGLVWAGNPSHKKDRSRSIELGRFEALAKIPGLRLYGLQKGDAALQAEEIADIMEIHNFGHKFYDFSDTAAVIANLDLVVSVDTAVAHLAGSMGKPIWLMLPYVPDWRWMLNRDDSPWYPTMRLFRQPEKGDWDTVLRRVASELGAIVSSRG